MSRNNRNMNRNTGKGRQTRALSAMKRMAERTPARETICRKVSVSPYMQSYNRNHYAAGIASLPRRARRRS